MGEAADPFHAWYVLSGVLFGLILSAGFAAWLTKKISAVIHEARVVVEEMRLVVAQAKGIAYHVASEYAPLKERVAALERKVEAIQKYESSLD